MKHFLNSIVLLLTLLLPTSVLGQDSVASALRARDSAASVLSADSVNEQMLAAIKQQSEDSLRAVAQQQYEDSIKLAAKVDSLAHEALDVMLAANKIAQPKGEYHNAVETIRKFLPLNFEFLVFVLLLLIPAMFKYINPSYFKNIFIAYKSPNLSARQLREQLSQNSLASFAMDFFACMVFATFVYVLLLHQYRGDFSAFFISSKLLLFSLLCIAFGLMYFIKKMTIKLAGWILRVQDVFGIYQFNLFLLNKVLAFVLLPFIAIMAFADSVFFQPTLFVTIFIIVFFFIQRYVRSVNTFNYLFNYSKLHFFLYLCASELLPLLVIAKVVVNNFMP